MSEGECKHLYIIDASIFIFRYYFSMPSNWFASNNRPTETVYGYALWLKKFLANEKPQNVVACFDESLGSCFRNEIYPDYKSSRELPDEDLAFQLLACKKITSLMGVPCYASDRYEADDLAGCFARLCDGENIGYSILTRDKDLSQLLYGNLGQLWDYPNKEPLGREDVFEKMGVYPEQVSDYLALVGDPSDDIPGVPGVGAKTACALLAHFGSWNEIRSNVESIHKLPIRGAKSLQNKIAEFSDQVELALKLTLIDTEAEVVSWGSTKRIAVDKTELFELASGLGFPPSFVNSIEGSM